VTNTPPLGNASVKAVFVDRIYLMPVRRKMASTGWLDNLVARLQRQATSTSPVKRKRIILFSILLVLFAAILWAVVRPDPPIAITGKLPAEDILEIKREVRTELKAAIFPAISLRSLKYLPGALKTYLKMKIVSIDSTASDNANVRIAPNPSKSGSTEWTYMMVKETNGWQINRTQVKTTNGTFQIMASTNHIWFE
jgi:hypothetical protein